MIKIRRYFIAGLIVVLPVVITIYILAIIFRFCDGIIGRYINVYLKEHLGYGIPGLGLFLSILIIFLTGVITVHLFSKKAFLPVKHWFLKIPLVKQIYPAAKQIINFLFSKEKPSFKKVVMIEYPRKGIWSLGFVTNEGMQEAKGKLHQDMLNVLIPNSPTPLSGYFMMVPKNDVIFLDISIEEGMKIIISGGVLNPEDLKKEA